MGKSQKQSIGFSYLLDHQAGICRGPVDEFVEIEAGGKKAWPNVYATAPVEEDLVVLTYDQMLAQYRSPAGTVVRVTDDGNPTLNGVYEKTGSGTWLPRALDGDGAATGMTDTGLTEINAPDLFGGKEKEGGIQGSLAVYFGKATQVYSEVIRARIGGLIPDFRGVLTVFFSGMISCNNPYPKEWRFRVRRSKKGWYNDDCWNECEATITLSEYGQTIKAMNPIHIIYEAMTNPEWGSGNDAADLDENSYLYASNVIYEEGFGLCLAWRRQEDVDTFIQVILDHIGAVQYLDKGTGKWTIRLLRNDYDVETIPLFTPTSGLLDITADDNVSGDAICNEILINYRSPIAGKDKQTREHNLAAFQSFGSTVSETMEFNGIPTLELANRVAIRELRSRSGLKRFKVTLDRRGWRIAPGSVFRVEAPGRGIGSIVLRAAHVDDGSFTSGKITVTALADMFSPPVVGTKTTDPGTSWTPPDTKPKVITEDLFLEASHYDVVRVGEDIEDDESVVFATAAQPNGLQVGFDLWTAAGADEFATAASSGFSPYGALEADLGPYETELVLTALSGTSVAVLPEGIIIDGPDGIEVCALTAVDATDGLTVTVKRGCVDTVPRAHPAGTGVFFYTDQSAVDETLYADAEVISGKLRTRSGSGVLSLASAPTRTVEIELRHARPYVGGDVQAGGIPVLSLTVVDNFEGIDANITWVDRDRLLQDDNLIGHDEAGIGPEAGTTYTLRFYDPTNTLIRTETGEASPGFLYTLAMRASDGDPDYVNVEFEAVRDGLVSWQFYRFRLNLVDHVYRDEDGEPFLDESGQPFLDEGYIP